MRLPYLAMCFCVAVVAVVILFATPSSAANSLRAGDVPSAPTGSMSPAFQFSPLLGGQSRAEAEVIRVAKKNKRRNKRKKWRKIRRAIGAAIITGIVVNELSRASRGRYQGRGQCRRWRRSCDRGYEEACRAYYRNCD